MLGSEKLKTHQTNNRVALGEAAADWAVECLIYYIYTAGHLEAISQSA